MQQVLVKGSRMEAIDSKAGPILCNMIKVIIKKKKTIIVWKTAIKY